SAAVATSASTALLTAFAMPEARVIALPETAAGGFDTQAAALLAPVIETADAVLIGPGMLDDPATQRLVAELLPLLAGRPVLLDALAMNLLRGSERIETPVLLTPHAGEMAHLTGASKESILAGPRQAALEAAQRWNCVVALKGATTWIATPQGRLWRHEEANCGLATSGSGDVLAGTMAGLAARGAPLEQAAAWGVVLHAHAGAQLAGRHGDVGFLARELPGEIPAALQALQGSARG
ncbi:MAG: NAD(P)H-hydrate dehydratase, partial [Comamonadaceae bacterium]